MLFTTNIEQNYKTLLSNLSSGKSTISETLIDLTETHLMEMLLPSFRYTGKELLVGEGDGILPGDVTGQLVLNRELGEKLLDEARRRNTKIDLIYSTPYGDLEDFRLIQSIRGFFTNQKGRTTFCPVQASCEGIPSIVGVNCTYIEEQDQMTYKYFFKDGSYIEIEQPIRKVYFSIYGNTIEILEGQFLSMSGRHGRIYKGELLVEEPLIAKVYKLLTQCYLEAIEMVGPLKAHTCIVETNTFQQNKQWLIDSIQSEEFQLFQELVHHAQDVTDLEVFATAHTTKGMVQTLLYASHISIDDDNRVVIKVREDKYALGLLRDERMWNDPEAIDLMRLIFLGPDVVGKHFNKFKNQYVEIFSNLLYQTFKVGVGKIAVIRLLCMPFKMIFTEKFDVKRFSQKFDLDEKAVRNRVNVLTNETETYHGCRGVRVTVQREDICELWCEGLLKAAKRANDEGIKTQIQILLSMVTFPQEVEMFIEVFERKIREMIGTKCDWIRGISVMIETSGAFHLIEDILDLKGKNYLLNGALFGGNDFTAACLNMNRTDSANSIIPSYVQLGIMNRSPFQTINTQIVGKAIVTSLRRIRNLRRINNRDYLIGLGGEIAGDWESVQWLTRHAAPLGLNYVSTPPERILFSLFASAQASLVEF
ncbi:hypothetical protein C1N76_19085 (plasmid) [Geobacillus thermoleovorans]|uniref:Pyruvate, phosphate dikinase n=1 Tax=Geobacillus thermoleovorans TaxID=33941 RepID=A0A2Z3NCF8_GEOTH|nr:putative PEP-binding protein [Geobacillus thermoleovorans]AWO76597.1 hypothetical protein C1N76_19085 [Geobacillus thermoleovorans]